MRTILVIVTLIQVFVLGTGSIIALNGLDDVLSPTVREAQRQGAMTSLILATIMLIIVIYLLWPTDNYRSIIKKQSKHVKAGDEILKDVFKNTNHEEDQYTS